MLDRREREEEMRRLCYARIDEIQQRYRTVMEHEMKPWIDILARLTPPPMIISAQWANSMALDKVK